MQERMLLELFSIPIGLKKVVKVDDIDLYTSDSLIENFVKALSESEILQAFSDKISSLVRSGRVIPCYINRGIIKVFLWKLLERGAEHKYGSSLAFFYTKTNAIYILIDNNTSYLGLISNDFLAKLIIHELAHMASFNDRVNFKKLFYDELSTFYSIYFQELFKISDVDKKYVMNYISDIMMLKRSGVKHDAKKGIAKTESFLDSLKKKYHIPKENFDKIKSKYMYVYKMVLYVDRDIKFMRELLANKEIIIPFARAYRKAFGMNILQEGVPFQEIWEPSEVICQYCEEHAPKEKVLKMLSLIK